MEMCECVTAYAAAEERWIDFIEAGVRTCGTIRAKSLGTVGVGGDSPGEDAAIAEVALARIGA
jgi:uncharacterized protein GlcG (DUF336 family)